MSDECERCHATMKTDDGCDPTDLCHNCAHERVEELEAQVQQLRETTLEEAASHIENASVYSAYEEIAKIHAKWVRSLAATDKEKK